MIIFKFIRQLTGFVMDGRCDISKHRLTVQGNKGKKEQTSFRTPCTSTSFHVDTDLFSLNMISTYMYTLIYEVFLFSKGLSSEMCVSSS